ncbi:FKBP-type peptidyl-prolyl cis-trans isomerase [Candidatus Saccharibacteria bacterium]|nr:FKBP-type peptidyl-prolyl cis-trans isomerase [Candidatus Saccharibacteria bacterium]
MEEKELKTSTKQRIGILIIAIVMLGSIIAGYAAIVINGSKKSDSVAADGSISDEKLLQYETEYADKLVEFEAATAGDFGKFIAYKDQIAAYNENTANTGGVVTKDLLVGDGRELAEGDTNYLAYYIGWCADESVFDSSLDNTSSPSAFTKALSASLGMIEGWNAGVVGMKLGGVRMMTIPGELAYGDKMEICGGFNKPLRFMVMAVANEDPLKTLAAELDLAYMKVQYGRYGIDYESL